MGVVVLDAERLDAVALQRVAGREVVGVEIVGDQLGGEREQPLEVRDAVPEAEQRIEVAQIADVGSHPGARAGGQAEGRLLLGAAGEDRPLRRGRQRDALRHVAAGAPDRQRPRGRSGVERAHHRVLGADVDRAAVAEEGVGDRAEPAQRFGVAVGDRLLGDVARGQHQGLAQVGEQQVMERRVGQHHAEVGAAGRDRGGDRGAGPAPGDRDRPLPPAEQALLGRAQLDQPPRRIEVGGDQREGLALAALAAPQLRNRALVGGPAGEVVAADPLDREDRAAGQHRRGGGDRVAVRGRVDPPPAGLTQLGARPAVRAGVRLGVEAAVAGVLVLGAAGGAHLEPGHRRRRAVVGDGADDREAGTAGGAVDERVAVATVAGVEQLGEAGLAGRRIRRDRRPRRAAALRGEDAELGARRAARRRPARPTRPRPATAPRRPAGAGTPRPAAGPPRPRARPRSRR